MAGADMTDAERWRAAEAISAGADDPVRRHRQRRGMIVLGALLAVVLLASAVWPLLLILILVAEQPGRLNLNMPGWRSGLVIVLLAIGVLVECIALVQLLRELWNNKVEPLAPLTRSQRLNLLRQVQGRAHIQVEHLPLARDMARSLHPRRGSTSAPPACC